METIISANFRNLTGEGLGEDVSEVVLGGYIVDGDVAILHSFFDVVIALQNVAIALKAFSIASTQ